MTELRSILETRLGPVGSLTPETTGQTGAVRARVVLADGRAGFVKLATDSHTVELLRREAALYTALDRSWLPRVICWEDGERPMLVTEDLTDALWPPRWPDDLGPLWAALVEVAAVPVPASFPHLDPAADPWGAIAAGGDGLGVVEPDWVERHTAALTAAAATVTLVGNNLTHTGLGAGTLCFSDRGPVMVGWGSAALGNPELDVATVAIDLTMAGRPLDGVPLTNRAGWAALLAALLAAGAGQPPPEWAVDGARLRAEQATRFEAAIAWACQELGLPLPRSSDPDDALVPVKVVFEREEVDAVRMVTFMPRFPNRIEFDRIAPSHWELSLDLPAEIRIEYLIETERGGHMERGHDPANPDTASNPMGSNSVLTGPAYSLPPWVTAPAWAEGAVTEIRVTSTKFKRRRHFLYSPPGTRPRTPLPLLVVHDGSDYLRYSQLNHALDVLISEGKLRPLRAVLLDPGIRHAEYIASPDHAAHVVDEVIPHLARRFNVIQPYGVLGASLGAVAAWHLADTYPDIFTSVFLQSGTFLLGGHHEIAHELLDPIRQFAEAAMTRPLNALVYQTCGRYEGLLDSNRTVAAALGSVYVETWAGHDWGAWRDHFEPGLALLFPPNRRG